MIRILLAVIVMTLFFACGEKQEAKKDSGDTVVKSKFDTSKTVEVADAAFGRWNDSLRQFVAESRGLRIKIRGQVLTSLSGNSGMKTVSRQKTNGCSHNITTLGLFCLGKFIEDAPESSWVLVTGRIAPDSVTLYTGSPKLFLPVLSVDSLLYSVAPAVPILGAEPGMGCSGH